jgi:hypothetical protein
MKYYSIIVILLLTLTSCYKQYSEPKTLSLSGEYIIDKITYSKIENSTSPGDKVYYGGDIYVNPNGSFPMDSINVGFTEWHLDYSVISFNPHTLNTGKVIWEKQYFYNVTGHHTNYDLGYLDFTLDDGSRRLFKIIDDGVENLVLRTTGQWVTGASGPEESVTLYLTRVGP